MSSPVRRAPGTEHPLRVRKRAVNPRAMQHLDDAGVAQVVDAAAARAYGDTIAGQLAEQAPVAGNGGASPTNPTGAPVAPYSTSQERFR